jgi:exoribonuclease R
MSSRRIAGAPLDFAALRTELEVPGDFSSAALTEAEHAATSPVADARIDATDLDLVTLDPAGSRDLDQAVHLARDGAGYLVHYAIADVAAFVAPGSALDAEVRSRGVTLYFPDARVLLHPSVLSEGAASLLPAEDRPAVLWTMALDHAGEVRSVHVGRAMVRSRRQYDYPTVQAELATAGRDDFVTLLAEIGQHRLRLARGRQAINLDLPEQQVVADPKDGWRLTVRAPLDVEAYNAEISLLTGMCAAQLMLSARVGLVRTVPRPANDAVARLRRAAPALHVRWPNGAAPGDVLAGLDRNDPHHVAFLDHAASLLRGASYVAFDGSDPADPSHAGVGAPYAQVTAPLRRLADRFATEVCLAVHAGVEIPAWARTALPSLPQLMQAADTRAHTVERAVIDMTEAWLLRDRIGERFSAVVIDANEHSGTIVLDDPPVRAHCDGAGLPVGDRISAQLAVADTASRQVRFTAA